MASITFKATSNDVKPIALPSRRDGKEPTAMNNIITTSKTFQTAFKDDISASGTSRTQPSIIQSSASSPADGTIVRAAGYGLVSAIMQAYNQHYKLVLRPDDVWQAILTQFSFYVNANAEALRDCFVDFQGKKSLVVEMPPGTLFSTDFATFANRMVDEKIASNLKDEDVVAWLLPKFSTTKTEDRVAASVTIMSTLQAYFAYHCCICCGIPEVTLEGTPADWHLLRQKIDRLPMYDIKGKDEVMKKWHGLLAPLLDYLVLSSEGHSDLHFWDTVCSHHGGGSGPSYLSGWVTVFSCFKVNGTWQGNVPEKHRGDSYSPRGNGDSVSRPKWPSIDTSDIPVGSVSVPVLVDDNGTQYDTQMLAGQFAYEMTTTAAQEGKFDTVRPRTDWCISYTGEPKAAPKNYKDGEIIVDSKKTKKEEEKEEADAEGKGKGGLKSKFMRLARGRKK